jgi:glutamine amidotransferase
MCDLFGMSCNAEDRAWKSLTVFANQHSDENPDGWGIAYYYNGKAIVKKAPEKAKTSQTFFSVIEKAKSNILIAHVRYATEGSRCEENCHPFRGKLFNRDWIFAHNGTIRNIPHHTRSIGETDSEQVFHLLLDEVESYQRTGIIHGIFSGIQQGIKNAFDRCGRDNPLCLQSL